MEIQKFNLCINQSFDKYKFDNSSDNSIFQVMSENMTQDTIYLVLSTKPENNTDFISIPLTTATGIYLFPTSTVNVSFNTGELIQTIDNQAIFIITNHIEYNLFELKLVWCVNGVSYALKTNTPSLIYNEKLEKKLFIANTNKTKIMDQWSNYTGILNSTNILGNYLSDQIIFNTNYTTDFTIDFNFDSTNTAYSLISNIIDKFLLNLLIYDYNDFKYIYKRDLIESVNDANYTLTASNKLMGIMKTANTKIIPHGSFKLKIGTTYSYTDSILNKYTSYSKSYTGDKVLVIMQLSLKDKTTVYDLHNNIESDSIFIII